MCSAQQQRFPFQSVDQDDIDANPYKPSHQYAKLAGLTGNRQEEEEQQDHQSDTYHLTAADPRSSSLPASVSFASSSSSCDSSASSVLDSFFHISERHSCISTEIRAGCVTWATMAYILCVNAAILNHAHNSSDGERMAFDSVITATALSAAIGTACAGLFANLPIGLAAGMGLNSYLTYGVVLKLNLSWSIALTAVFIHGFLFLVLSLLGTCNLIQVFAPPCIKKSITVGLGLFQALIGFEQMKLVVSGHDVLLTLGNVWDARVCLSIFGLFLVAVLLVFKVKASMLIGMAVITAIGWITGLENKPLRILQWPSMGNTFFQLDFTGYWDNLTQTAPVTLMFLFVSIFDTAGVQLMAGTQAGLLDEHGQLPGSKAAFVSAAVSTMFASLFGCSPVIIHTESCAGIADGAKTGLHSVVVALLFLLSLPFVPVLMAVPSFVTAPALVIVGMYMMAAAKFIDWERIDEALPAFLTATILPLTYSISNGVLAGLGAFLVLKSAAYCSGTIDPSIETAGEDLPPHLQRRRSRRSMEARGVNEEEEDGQAQPSGLTTTPSGLKAAEDPAPGSPIPYFLDHRAMMTPRSHTNPPPQEQPFGRSLYRSYSLL